MQYDPKLLALLDVVIDNYICKGEPVGSKFLHSLEDVEYAPSTLRKYLHVLETDGMVYQPYNSSGRIPTVQGLTLYIERYLAHQEQGKEMEVVNARDSMKQIVEAMGSLVDGVVVGFLRNDEYYYLGINNLLRDDLVTDYQATRELIRFIEEKKVVRLIDSKMLKHNALYYTFIEDNDLLFSCLYVKISMAGYDGIISIIGPTRVNYKQNVSVLRQLLMKIS